MNDTFRMAQYFKVSVPDKPGEGARALGVFRNARVNLDAFICFPRGRRGQLNFIPSDPDAFKAAAKHAKLKVTGPRTCFLAEGDDRLGVGAELMAKLAAAKINITAFQAIFIERAPGARPYASFPRLAGSDPDALQSVPAGRYAALFWVKPRDVKKAAKVLGLLMDSRSKRERRSPASRAGRR